MTHRRGCALMGWVNEVDVRPLYHGASVTKPDTFEAFKELWRDAQTRVAKLPFDGRRSVATDTRYPSTLAGDVAALQQSEMYRLHYEPFGGTVAAVPLDNLVTPQWWVDMDYIEELTGSAPAEGDEGALLRFCFACGQLGRPAILGGNVAAFVSHRRDLVQPSRLRVESFAPEHVTFSFDVTPRPNYLYVARVVGPGVDCLLVLNGVHHLVALLRAGSTRAYCVLRTVQVHSGELQTLLNFTEPAIFKPALLLSQRPPLVRDYLNEEIADETALQEYSQFLRIPLQSELGFLPRVS